MIYCLIAAILALCSVSVADHCHTTPAAPTGGQEEATLGGRQPAPPTSMVPQPPTPAAPDLPLPTIQVTSEESAPLIKVITGGRSPGREWEFDHSKALRDHGPLSTKYQGDAAPPSGTMWYTLRQKTHCLVYYDCKGRATKGFLKKGEKVAILIRPIRVDGTKVHTMRLVKWCANWVVGIAALEVEVRQLIKTITWKEHVSVPGPERVVTVPGPVQYIPVPGPERIIKVRVPVVEYRHLPTVDAHYWGGPPNEKGEKIVRVERIAEFSITWFDLVRRVRERKLPCPICPPGQHPSPFCPIGGQPGPEPLPGTVQPHFQQHVAGDVARPSSWNGVTNPPPQPVGWGENYGSFFDDPFRPDSW